MAQRDHSLDGLRGLAALVVAIFHFACAYAPEWLPEQTPDPLWITDTPLSIFYSGSFAVSVFFVLSGYVVSGSAAQRKHSLPVLLGSRYLRLAIPVVFSTLFAWALLNAFPDGVARLKQQLPHPWLAWSYDGATPGLWSAVWDGTVMVFLRGSSDFNNALWTMKMELVGSFAIYFAYSLPRRWRGFGLLLLVLLAVRRMEYAGFLTGALLREHEARLPKGFGWPALAVGVLLGSQLTGYGERLGLPTLPARLSLGHPRSVWYVLGATAIVYAVLTTAPLKALFSTPPLRFLGKVSFPLYLIHVPLLYTVFAHAYGRAPLGVIFAAYLGVSLLLALWAERLIDAPTLKGVRRFQARASLRLAPR